MFTPQLTTVYTAVQPPAVRMSSHTLAVVVFSTDDNPQPPPVPYFWPCASHPRNTQGFVTDGSPQCDDAHCVGDPRQQAMCVTARRFSDWQSAFACLSGIVNHEDPGWDPTRWNTRGSGAYGLPQALPGSKMAMAGLDWSTNAGTQVRWLLDDYSPHYGGICGAWAHEQAYGTY